MIHAAFHVKKQSWAALLSLFIKEHPVQFSSVLSVRVNGTSLYKKVPFYLFNNAILKDAILSEDSC
uniref:Uncharacterized protein n=1 Tax=Anguilla anguilla TaxID=7936 RepID=A0A0E9WC20_ANGAN